MGILKDAKYFTTLDIRSGFWCMSLSEDAERKTTFTYHMQMFRCTRIPFGLKNPPANIIFLMDTVLEGLQSFVVNYVDDTLTLSKIA